MTIAIVYRHAKVVGRFLWSAREFVLVASLVSSCSLAGAKKEVNGSLTHQIRHGMSEKAVVELLGKPMRVTAERYEPNNPASARILSYKLDDGRTWMVVINEQDMLIGSGEKVTGRSKE